LDRNDHQHYPIPYNVKSASNCLTNEFGFYGSTGKFDETIRYQYEVEVKKSGLSESFTVDDLILVMENSIANKLLESNVFSDLCGRRRLNQNNRALQAVGITTIPEDIIINQQCSSQLLDTVNDDCFVVDGEVMVFLTVFDAEIQDEVRKYLKAQMNDNNAFDDAHSSVRRVTYTEPTSIPFNNADPNISPRTTQPSENSISSGFFLAIAVGAFCIIGTGVFYRRGVSETDDNGDVNSQPLDMIQEDDTEAQE